MNDVLPVLCDHPQRNSGRPRRDGRRVLGSDYTEKYSSYSNGCGRCAAGVISAVRL